MKKALVCFTLVGASLFSFSQTFTLNDTLFQVGSIYRTYRIHFGLGSQELDPASKPLLDSILVFLINHPALKVEIGVHSDLRDSDLIKPDLSRLRSREIMYYFIQRDPYFEKNIWSAGYGKTKPLITDAEIEKAKTKEEKEAKHALNRRVEFKIIRIN